MEKETLEALKRSIQKWESIESGIGIDRGSKNCALCEIFVFDPDYRWICSGCPVSEKTGFYDCTGTPYDNWHKHHLDKHCKSNVVYFPAYCPECRDIAKQEVNFLKSLLPE